MGCSDLRGSADFRTSRIFEGEKGDELPFHGKELDGAFVTHGAAEVDGNVITGRGMGCAIDFALKIIGCLISEEEAAAQAERIVYER